jgi:hypothetical protein
MQTAIYSYLHTLPRTQRGDLEAVKVGKIGIEQGGGAMLERLELLKADGIQVITNSPAESSCS